MRSILFISILVLLCSFNSIKGKELFFEKITGSGEMPNTSIRGISKDSMGFIWIGSWHGLYRYDGKEFEVFRHNDNNPHSLSTNRIRNVITDDNKQLWVLTYDMQYLKYNYNQNYFNRISDSIVPQHTSLLLNSTPNYLNKFSLINGERFIIASNRITTVNKETKAQKQYLANLIQPGGLKDDFVTSFFVDDQDIVWIGTRSGTLYKANTNRKPFHLQHIYADRQNSLKRSPVRAIYQSNTHTWLGTNHNGLILYSDNKITYPLKGKANEELQIRSITKDSLGNIWIGGAHGLGYIDSKNKTYKSIILKDSFADRIVSVFDIKSFKEKRYIWAAVFNSLLRVDIITKEYLVIPFEGIIGEKSIMKFEQDNDNNFWLATEGNGIVRVHLDNNETYTDYLTITTKGNKINGNRLTGNLVYALHYDRNNNIWVGTSEGINIINANDLSIKYITSKEGISDTYIAAITEDLKGNIWVSHKKGISRITPTNFKISNYPIKEGNNEWTFLDGAFYNDTTSKTLYFGATQGYVSFNPTSIKENPYPPLIEFHKFYINENEVQPNQEIAGKIVLDKSLPLTSSITLGYSYRNFYINVSALHYERPESNRFLYKLEGYDNNWRQTPQNLLSFSRIPAGDYVLKVKAVTPDGIESATKELRVKILSPWYSSNWAIAGYILFVLSILVLVYREILVRERLKNRILLERIDIAKKEELNREKIEFFTNVSHELRTPLSLITDPVKRLEDPQLPIEKRTRYIKLVRRNIEHLSTLINQLLDFRKAESGKLEADYSVEDVVKLVRQCTESFHMNATNRDISLKYHSNISKFLCYIDRNKVEQVLFNLISNAFKYTSNGGKILVTSYIEVESGQLQVKIMDNGIGIDSESQKKIFEPFNTVGSAPFDGNSTGIGLALTRNLITVLNGKITLESAPKKGTTVIVTLPVKSISEADITVTDKDINQEPEATVPNKVAQDESSDKKPIILIVEDNEDVQEYLIAELEDDYSIHQEGNGIDGLKSAVSLIPDIIISDIMMPYMDGIAMCKELKEKPQTSHIPLVMLTAKTTEENKVEGLNTGADYYISKPFSINVLKAQLKSIIENRLKLQESLAHKEHLSSLEQANTDIDNEYIQKVIDIVQTNMAIEGYGTENLAKELNISQRQLYRKIKALSGSSTQEFIIRVKMDEAVKMLVNDSLTISEVSYALGYSEPSNFTRTFTKHFGQSPTNWVKLNKSKYKTQ